jgi:hypothetical protein
MSVIPTLLDRRSDAFRANDRAMRVLVQDLRDQSAAIAEGGEDAVAILEDRADQRIVLGLARHEPSLLAQNRGLD